MEGAGDDPVRGDLLLDGRGVGEQGPRAATLTIYNLAAFVGCAIASALFIQPRLDRRWLVFTLAPLVVLITTLALRDWRVTFGPPNEVDWISSLIIVIIWIAMSPIGYRVWLLRQRRRMARDPRSEFDRQVYLAVRPLSRLLLNQPANVAKDEWVQSIVATRQHSLDALVALRPPTAEWAGVRDSYVSLLRDEFEAPGRETNPTEDAQFRAKAAAIAVRVRALRVAEGRNPARV